MGVFLFWSFGPNRTWLFMLSYWVYLFPFLKFAYLDLDGFVTSQLVVFEWIKQTLDYLSRWSACLSLLTTSVTSVFVFSGLLISCQRQQCAFNIEFILFLSPRSDYPSMFSFWLFHQSRHFLAPQLVSSAVQFSSVQFIFQLYFPQYFD